MAANSTQYLNDAKDQAFKHGDGADKHAKKEQSLNNAINDSKYSLTPVWQFLSVVILFSIAGLLYYAAANSNIILRAILPQSNAGSGPNLASMAIAIGLSGFGIVIGHSLLSEKQVFNTNDITGARSISGKFILKLVGAIGYIVLQFIIVFKATGGQHMNFIYLHMGIVCLELLLGGLFFGQSIYVLSVWFSRFRISRLSRVMYKTAKATSELYTYYLTALSQSGTHMGSTSQQPEDTESLKAARNYYDSYTRVSTNTEIRKVS